MQLGELSLRQRLKQAGDVMSEPLLKAPEAMALLNVRPTKFYDLQKQGLVVAVSFGPRCKRYDRADLLAVVEKLKRPALPDQ